MAASTAGVPHTAVHPVVTATDPYAVHGSQQVMLLPESVLLCADLLAKAISALSPEIKLTGG